MDQSQEEGRAEAAARQIFGSGGNRLARIQRLHRAERRKVGEVDVRPRKNRRHPKSRFGTPARFTNRGMVYEKRTVSEKRLFEPVSAGLLCCEWMNPGPLCVRLMLDVVSREAVRLA